MLGAAALAPVGVEATKPSTPVADFDYGQFSKKYNWNSGTGLWKRLSTRRVR